MDNAIIQKVNTLLAEGFEVDEALMTPDADLKTTLDLDSLDYIDLIAMTESKFDCKLTHEDLEGIRTFSDLYRYIAAQTVRQ